MQEWVEELLARRGNHQMTGHAVIDAELGRWLALMTPEASADVDAAVAWVTEPRELAERMWDLHLRLAAQGRERDAAVAARAAHHWKWSPAAWCTTDLSERVPPT